MADKRAPLGICDLCGAQMPDAYTAKGRPRLYCSRECRNTSNSRAGAASRTRKLHERIAAGSWVNPAMLRPPTSAEQAARARKGRLREVAAGVWRNPALGEAARAKLSRPRKHSGALAEAMERLKQPGVGMADLTPPQQDAYRAYAREMQSRRRARWTDAERAAARKKWREAWRKRRQ